MRKRTVTEAAAVRSARPARGVVVAPPRIRPFMIGLVGTLGVLLALLIGAVIGQLSTVLVYIGLALFLALGLDPVVSLLERKLPRPGAIAIVVGVVLLAFAGIVVAIVPVLVEQGTNLIKDLPRMIKDLTAAGWYQDIQAQFGSTVEEALNSALHFLQDPANLASIGGGIVAVGAGVAGGVTGVVIVLILTLYFLAALPSMKKLAARFVPAYQREGFTEITNDVSGAVGRYVIGQFSLALINGVLSLIFLSIIGAPLPALLALIAFIGSLIPMVGTLIGAILISLICLLASPLTALVAAIYYLIYMQVEAYVLSPRIMNKAVDVPGSIVVIAAVAGGTIGGVLGALVAIPVAASGMIIIQKVVFPAQDAKLVDPELEGAPGQP
ncbi:AI-2E family transporter [Microterricola viridarii]|uniref:Predicted PurR-regulated permease PerM n=1 Tax=Microterricola viridarii TaxID=412690 RepID=A0A1H1YSH0_9MICO|nr:AI-2E family transporter [Microterricola viridarii]SDT24229.1 Predicted PurR-regulated permease PerM [Microterricola viridarii]